jgi:tetratricopeptide (TPR) repeat protein
MERLHANLYHTIAPARFAAAIDSLSERIPALAAHDIVVGMARIVALIGDGHTSLPLYFATGVDFHVVPVRFGFWSGVLHVEAADRAFAEIVGARVVAFNEVPVDSALALVTPLISRDNDEWITAVAPNLLNRAEVLHALGLSTRLDSAVITVEKDSRRRTVRIAASSDVPASAFGLPFLQRLTSDWIDARDSAASPPPLHQRTFDSTYAFEYLADRRMLWLGFHQVANREHAESALEFFRRATAYARDNASRIDRVVLDLRNDTGGEGGLLDPIVREIVRAREIDRPGRFFVVIGPRTFSAAVMLAAQLDRYTTAIFAGMPTGSAPNVYGSHDYVHLPFSGIGVAVSPDFIQAGFPTDARRRIDPQIAVSPTFADYVANRDPVLDAIAAWDGGLAFTAAVLADLAAADTAAAVRRVNSRDADPIHRFDPSTAELNRVGYDLLRAANTASAIDVFRLNVRVHPDYANGWDSLGEAYAANGNRDQAIAAYERALALDPANSNARDWLGRLRGRDDGG